MANLTPAIRMTPGILDIDKHLCYKGPENVAMENAARRAPVTDDILARSCQHGEDSGVQT